MGKEYIISRRPISYCDCRLVTAEDDFEACHEAAGISDDAESDYFIQWDESLGAYGGCGKDCRLHRYSTTGSTTH